MITFGYRSRVNGPMRALIALAVGVMMVVSPANALALVVTIIAAFMLASGIVSFVVGLKDRANGAMPLMSFNALVNILVGILLFSFPGLVARFIIYLVGFALFAFGVLQLIALFSVRNAISLRTSAFILPAVVTFIGGFILFNPFAESVMTIIAGSALILYGVSEFVSSWRMKKVAGYEKVDEQEAQVIEQDDQIDEQ